MARMTATPSTASALVCATLLTTVLAGQPAPAGAAPLTRPASASGAAPPGAVAAGRAGGSRIERLARQVDTATRAFESARRDTRAQRRKAERLRRATAAKRREARALHQEIGRMAAAQYRDGGLPATARLLLSATPEDVLARAALLRKGAHATSLTLARARTASAALARHERAARDAHRALRRRTAQRDALLRSAEAKLAEARKELRTRRAAGPAGQWQLAAGGRARPSRSAHRPAHSSGAWVAPVRRYQLSAGFAAHGRLWARGHSGQDFAVPQGTPVRAAGGGTVERAGRDDDFGNNILIRHPNGYFTHYAHLSSIAVRPGQRVRAGERIGLSGNTGNSSGPHLHFEVRTAPWYGSGVDPVPWLRGHGVRL